MGGTGPEGQLVRSRLLVRAATVALWISLCANAATAGIAGADEPAPEAPGAAAGRHFASGEAAYEAGDFSRAGASFEAAYEAQPHPIALWNAARSWERAGEPVRAANLYRAFLNQAPPDTPHRDRATQALAELSKRVGRLEIVMPKGEALAIDGRPLGAARVTYVAPGAHLLAATIDGQPLSRQIAIGAAETLTVVLELLPPPHVALPPVAAPAPSRGAGEELPRSGVSPWAIAPFAGLTALSGALLIWSGVDTLVALDLYEGFSEAEKVAYYDEGKAKQDRTNVLVGITGGLGLITAAVALFAIDWGHGTVVGVGPSEVRVVVAF